MQITPIKTHKITTKDNNILTVIDKYIKDLKENSILVVTSKIVSLCEGNVVPDSLDKDELVQKEADMFLPKETNKYQVTVTIKDSVLAVNAGIDESNSNNGYVLWPKDVQKSANNIRTYLKKKFRLKNIGVIITDSKTTPLRYGVTGIALAHSGFSALNDLIGKEDVFGRKMKITKVNVMDGIAAGATVVMGEGAEQTPLSIVTDLPFVNFVDHNPTKEELSLLDIDPITDVYGVFLKSAPWKSRKNS